MKLGSAVALSFPVLVLAGRTTLAAPPDVAEYLAKVARFTPERLAALEGGQAIVQTAVDEQGEVAVVGAVRIRTSKEHVQLYLDQYLAFEDGSMVLRVGRFGDPPTLQDVARLELDPRDIDALRDCRPGDCGVNVGGAIEQLRGAIDWRAPDHAEQVNRFVRQRLVDYVTAYRQQGDAALVSYVDKPQPLSLAGQWRELLANARYLYGYAPELKRYLESYPEAPLAGGRDLIQWSKVDQGTGPVVLLTHVVQYQDPARPDRLSLALKQIYASRLYEGALSLATVVDAGPAEAPAAYLVFVNRTRSDVLRGALGRMKRRITGSEVAKATELTLRQMQEGLERTAGAR
jgi:hypothetical protein